MAIQSINTLQNKDNYNSIAKEYVLESLANLGQRYSVKGDSISIGTLTLDKLFNTEDITDTSVAIIRKTDTGYSIYLADRDNTNGRWNLSIPEDNTKVLSTNENDLLIESFYLPNNPGVQYSNVHVVSEELYYDIYGRQDYNTTLNKTNFFYERYSKSNNELVRGIRIYKKHFGSNFLPDKNAADKYLLVDIRKNNESYDVKLYLSRLTIDNIRESEIYNFLANDVNIDAPLQVSSLFDTYIINTTIEVSDNIFKPNSELMAICPTTNDESILSNYIMYGFSDDNINLYTYLKSEYSTSKFGTIESIYTQLFKSLFECISSEENDLRAIYIPCLTKSGKLFEITYAYNTNKPEEIYFSGKEIVVNFIPAEITTDWLSINLDEYRDNIFVHTNKVERTSFYFFESSIDPISGVNGIYTRKISTLPYIDDNGYWIINDINTGIYARGKSAGNPNIIIVETLNKEGGCNILSGAKREELLKNIFGGSTSGPVQEAKIEPLEKINLNDISFNNASDYLTIKCAIPDLSKIPEVNRDDYLAMLDNSLIINISPISCIDYENSNINYTKEDIEEMYGQHGVITTLWVINEQKTGFDYLRKRNNKYAAADFNYISNINNLIQHAVKNVEALHPDNYEFTNLVFDSTYTTLKNNTSEEVTYIYPNIVNKKSADYGLSNYNNDINFTFKANDIIYRNGKVIEGLAQSGNIRFYNATYNNTSSNSSNIVTNALYEYYNDGVSGRYNEYIPNYNVPSLDLGEVLTRNETLLNRLNILSFDNLGTAFLSYVGTSFEDDKATFRIGTSNTNINMGSNTLLYENDRESFVKQKNLAIDFDKVKIGGSTEVEGNLTVNSDIYLSGNTWNKDYISMTTSSVVANVTYYTSIVTPVARYIYELKDHYENSGIVELYPVHGEAYSFTMTRMTTGTYFDVDSEEMVQGEYDETIKSTGYIELDDNNANVKTLLDNTLYKYCIKKNKLYIIGTTPEYFKTYPEVNENIKTHKIYFSDGIYLPVLLNKIGLDKFVKTNGSLISIPDISITSNMNIIYVNNNPMILLSSSTNLYPDKYIYERINNGSIDTTIESLYDYTYTVFTANPFKITYYQIGAKLYIHIEELNAKPKFVPNKKLKTNYIV